MTDFAAIETTMKEICNCAAKALDRFCCLTALSPESMHESFMASFVFDRLGEKVSMVPELTVGTIWEWKHWYTAPKPPLPGGVKGQQRIDLILFCPQDSPKRDQRPWCLIEFKRRENAEADYQKLGPLLPLLGCHFGAACAVIDAEKNHDWLLLKEPADARNRGEKFIVSDPLEVQSKRWAVYAYLFSKAGPCA